MLDLRGRAAIVTGGASGIGAEVVGALQAAGARVASLDLQTAGVQADVVLECDVSDEAQVERSVAAAREALGGVELAFVNAGVAGMGGLLDLPMQEWDRVMGINLRGAFMTLQHCARAIVEGGQGGAIVATASSAAIVSDVGLSHYSASKIALTHLVRVAARELGSHAVMVGDTFPVGCAFSDRIVYAELFADHPDRLDPQLSSTCGIYEKSSGLRNVHMSWGHDEYLYRVLENHLPDPARYMIRFHSFYAWHREAEYDWLCDEHDREMLPWVQRFNSYDLYSKSPQPPDWDALRPTYEGLIAEYLPAVLCF